MVCVNALTRIPKTSKNFLLEEKNDFQCFSSPYSFLERTQLKPQPHGYNTDYWAPSKCAAGSCPKTEVITNGFCFFLSLA